MTHRYGIADVHLYACRDAMTAIETGRTDDLDGLHRRLLGAQFAAILALVPQGEGRPPADRSLLAAVSCYLHGVKALMAGDVRKAREWLEEARTTCDESLLTADGLRGLSSN